jgi:hypothetical protein
VLHPFTGPGSSSSTSLPWPPPYASSASPATHSSA